MKQIANIEEVKKLNKKGLSLRQIAKEVGVSFQRVSQILHNYKSSYPKKHRLYFDLEVMKKNNLMRTKAYLILNRLSNNYVPCKLDENDSDIKIIDGEFWRGVIYSLEKEPERFYMEKGKKVPVMENYNSDDFI